MSRAPKSAIAFPFHTSEIEIIAVPDGEAPEWVRRAWVGVIVPLAAYEPMEWECYGVLSSPKSRLGLWLYRWTGRARHKIGYAVMADAGVDSLEQTAPDAAQWWREHTPHMLDGTRTLLFEADVCRRVKAPRPVPAND